MLVRGQARIKAVLQRMTYEESMVFLASRQKEEEKNSYPTGYIPHLTREVLATKLGGGVSK